MNRNNLARSMGIMGEDGPVNFGGGGYDSGMGDDLDRGYYGYHGGDDGFGFGDDGFGDLLEAFGEMGDDYGFAGSPQFTRGRGMGRRGMAGGSMVKARVADVLKKHAQEQAATSRREQLLHPNRGSRLDIERYDFTLNQTPSLVLGTASPIAMALQPAVTIRPQRACFNAPSYAFAIINSVLSANVNVLVGGSIDAGVYNALAVGIHLDTPTLSPANKLAVNGQYTGLIPPGYPVAFPYMFVASFQCPATVVA
jgi:hypothetical protein